MHSGNYAYLGSLFVGDDRLTPNNRVGLKRAFVDRKLQNYIAITTNTHFSVNEHLGNIACFKNLEGKLKSRQIWGA